ncbi:hypothetical protein BaRGS_00022683 [Batillaria attramentaria]|uniref:G-protein coupled receptors family 1 profile domain-containing protein n=1 Tax=Batillaria attramentaria TaxID=370345 RepID=A0ABD0KGA1_9CAEN
MHVILLLQVWPWIHNVFLGLSLLVVLFSNSLIIVNVKQSSSMTDYSHGYRSGPARDAGMRRESVGSLGSSGRRRQITVMMLAESFTTLILSYPFAWYMFFSAKDPEIKTDPDKWAMNQLLFPVFFYMLYSNKCVNFFLYVVSGYKFRLALKQVFTWHRGSAETPHAHHDGHGHIELHACHAHAHAHDTSILRGSLSTITTSFSNRDSTKRSETDDDPAKFAANAHRRHSVTFCLQTQVSQTSESDVKSTDVTLSPLERIASQRRSSVAAVTIQRRVPDKTRRNDGQTTEIRTNSPGVTCTCDCAISGYTTTKQGPLSGNYTDKAAAQANTDARARSKSNSEAGIGAETSQTKPESSRSVEMLLARAAMPQKVMSIGVRCMMKPKRRDEKRIVRLIEFIPLFLPVNAVPETDVG